MAKKWLTVLLPVYKAGHDLHLAIQSILNQTHADFEFLIIDDFSPDNSAAIIEEYAKKDSRIRAIYHDANCGLARTLNEGLNAASFNLVVRMDQDDESLPHRLERQLAFMEENLEVAVAGSHVYHMGAKTSYDRLVETPSSYEEIKNILPQYNPMYHPSVILRRDVILAMGGYRIEFKNAEDYDLWLRVSQKHKMANIPEPLIRYRFTTTGMTLGRKWEQLYYVCLAQVAHQKRDASMQLIHDEAKIMHDKINRAEFLNIVAVGTVKELVSLRMWLGSFSVARTFSGDIGIQSSIRLLIYIAKSLIGMKVEL